MRWLMTVDSCCFCVSLDLASCIIGHVEMLSGLITLFHDFTLVMSQQVDSYQVMGVPIIACGFMSDFLSSAVQVLMGFVLICGVKTNRLSWINSWSVVHLVFLGVSLLCYLSTASLAAASTRVDDMVTFQFLLFLYIVRNFLVYGFCIIIVNSYYEKRKGG